MDQEYQRQLDIYDENEQIIGRATRAEIHRAGLLHREVHVWFYTPQGEVIFQHRAPNKDTYPDLLDATVGGHVEIGDNYLDSAIKETEEETGLKLRATDLKFVVKNRRCSKDELSNTVNNCWGEVYAYCFSGSLSDLRPEAGKGIGFEAWSIEKLLNITSEEKKLFIHYWFELENQGIFTRLAKIIKKG